MAIDVLVNADRLQVGGLVGACRSYDVSTFILGKLGSNSTPAAHTMAQHALPAMHLRNVKEGLPGKDIMPTRGTVAI